MSNIFFISDTHWGHEGPYTKFFRQDGTILRPHGSAEAGDAAMIENWNSVVRPNDKVYHVGDVCMSTKTEAFSILAKLNGTKVLIKGNHDMAKMSVYMQYFKDVRAVHRIDEFVLTHVPIHPQSIERWGTNVHGHLHHQRVTYNLEIDPRYFNVSVECINYTPIEISELKKRIKEQQNV